MFHLGHGYLNSDLPQEVKMAEARRIQTKLGLDAWATPGAVTLDAFRAKLRRLPLNPHPGRLQVNSDPPVFLVEDFLSGHECEALIRIADCCSARA